MEQPSPYQFNQTMEIHQPKAVSGFPISFMEWQSIKDSISLIDDSNSIFHTIGSVLLGAGISTGITAIITDFDASRKFEKITMWSVAICCMICGILSMVFAHLQKSMIKKSAKNVCDQMALIEARWPKSTISADQPPQPSPAYSKTSALANL